MSPRLQRLLIIALLVNFILFGVTFYTELTMSLRLFQQVLTILLFAGWLVSLWHDRCPFPHTPLDRLLLLYGTVWLAAAIFAQDARISLEYTWPTLVYILGFYLLVDVMRHGRQRWVFEALFTVSAVVVIITAIEMAAWYFGYPLLPGFVQGWPSVGGLTIPPGQPHKAILALNVSTVLGDFTATMIPITIAWAITVRQRDLRGGLWLLVGGLVATLAFSGSRGGLIALAASTGVLLLAWLLRPEIRSKFPRVVRPLLAPRLIVGAALVVGAVFISGIFYTTISGPLRGGDLNRLDLWRSAIAMFRDHPLLGVGPYQYGSALRWYGYPDFSQLQDRLSHAHNALLQIVAEGGIVVLTAAFLLAGAFLRLWWKQWRAAYPGRRRRLEGALAAMIGFGVHNLVDTFTQIHLIVPLLILAAYIVAGDTTRLQFIRASQNQTVKPQDRRLTAALLAFLLIIQIAFVPVSLANLAFAQSRRALASHDLAGALSAIRSAHGADPALALYPLQEAYILGLMAAESPAYLDEAIAAHESSQALNPTWDTGWHNLAALYAQAGQLESAIRAEQTAIQWNPVPGGYHLKLGEYYETLGQLEEARTAYFDALERSPEIGSSGFWTDPDHPWRRDIPDQAVDHVAARYDIAGLLLALKIPDMEKADSIALVIEQQPTRLYVPRLLGQWAVLVDDTAIAPCPECYFYESLDAGTPGNWLDYGGLAEVGLRNADSLRRLNMSPEQAARAALFLSQGDYRRSWYLLALLAGREGENEAIINNLLARAVQLPSVKQDFSAMVYGRVAAFDYLPQGRFPLLARYDLEPWLRLAERYEQAGDVESAHNLYERLLIADPYGWDLRERLAALPEE